MSATTKRSWISLKDLWTNLPSMRDLRAPARATLRLRVIGCNGADPDVVLAPLSDRNSAVELKQFLLDHYCSLGKDPRALLCVYGQQQLDGPTPLRFYGLRQDSVVVLAVRDALQDPADGLRVRMLAHEDGREESAPAPDLFRDGADSETDSDDDGEVPVLFDESSGDEEEEPGAPAWWSFAPQRVAGKDVVTLEEVDNCYTLPCGHAMSRESLVEHALHAARDGNPFFKCPCVVRNAETCQTPIAWPVLRRVMEADLADGPFARDAAAQRRVQAEVARLEALLAQALLRQLNVDVQPCPTCGTVLFRKPTPETTAAQCVVCAAGAPPPHKLWCWSCADSWVPRARSPSAASAPTELDDDDESSSAAPVDLFAEERSSDESEEEDEEPAPVAKEETKQEEEEEEEHSPTPCVRLFDESDTDNDSDTETAHYDAKGLPLGEGGCGRPSCAAAFRLQALAILRDCPRKTIGCVDGVPTVRACPKCGQLIDHWEYCKHMECQRCYTEFCFVCLKLYLVDEGRWQCGDSDDVCPIAPVQQEAALRFVGEDAQANKVALDAVVDQEAAQAKEAETETARRGAERHRTARELVGGAVLALLAAYVVLLLRAAWAAHFNGPAAATE